LLLLLLPLLLVVLIHVDFEVFLPGFCSRFDLDLLLSDGAELVLYHHVGHPFIPQALPLRQALLWFLFTDDVALSDRRNVIHVFVLQLQQASDFVVANSIVSAFVFQEVVDGDLVVEHVVGGYYVRIAGQLVIVPLLVNCSDLPGLNFAHHAASTEIGVVQGFLRSDSFFGVHLQHLLQKIETLLIYLSEVPSLDGLQILNFWKPHSDELRVLQKVLVVLRSQGSETFLD
jgi:hypothetical protein